MATFSQWQRSGCPVRRVTWVCGPEQVLADDVCATVRAGLSGAGVVVFFAGTDTERDIWAAAGVVPPDGQQRLVIVYDAHKLRRPAELVPLVKAGREAAGVYLLFVSAEQDFSRDKDGLVPHLAAVRDSRNGQLVRCTAPKDDDLLDWAARCWPGLGRNAAWRLTERAGGDLAAVAEAGAKAVATGLTAEKYIEVLCAARPGAEFAEYLIRGDRAGALAVLAAGGLPSPGAAIGMLDSRLSRLAAIREGQQRQLPDKDIAARFGVDRFWIARYRDVAQQYGPGRVRRCRELLAEADAAWRTGAGRGVAEVLAANW